MKCFGLTGGIGMGKSTATEMLQRWSVPVIDTDIIAREIVEPGQPALEEIKMRFGSGVIESAGSLRRDELARLVFSDERSRRDLEAILHPRIREVWGRQVEQWRVEQRPIAVVVIPLLFETGAEKQLDATICVACSEATQQRRLAERGWNLEQMRQRIQAQWPIEKKMFLANYVIWTEGTLAAHEEQLRRVLRVV